MKCERCNEREADVHIRHQKGNDIEEHHLCRHCAEQMSRDGLIPDMTFDLPIESFLGGLFSGPKPGHPVPEGDNPKVSGPVCGRCGLDNSGFRRSGKYGCPDCFKVFHDDLGPLLRKIHGYDIHRGVRPKTACAEPSCIDGLDALKQALSESIEKEEYERAAVIRDKIREIEENHEDRR